MKNFFTILFFCCLFSNCSEDNNQATFTTPTATSLASRPEASSTFDNSYKGIYKGIVIGNISGSLYVDILNDNKIWARLQTDDLETYVLKNVPLLEGESKSVPSIMKKFRFANENVSFEIKLDEFGNNISISNFVFFSDDELKVCLIKEKSNSLIKCYTGSFKSLDEKGYINFTSNGELSVKGLSKKLNSTDVTIVSGKINMISPLNGISKAIDNNPIIRYQLNANLHLGNISGTLDGIKFNGNWMYEDHELGNWNADRIL